MTDLQILQDLVHDTCRCKSHKAPNDSFCHKCYASLPPTMKRDLYKRIGKGYEQAFKDALQFLGYGEQPGLFADPNQGDNLMRTCRVCGCTDTTPCISPCGLETCAWVELDLCDFCAADVEDQPLVEVFSEADASNYLRARGAAGGLL